MGDSRKYDNRSQSQSATPVSVMVRCDRSHDFYKPMWENRRKPANVPLEQLPAILTSIPGTFSRPLRPSCYMADLLTTLLLADSPLLENEHRVLLESACAGSQGLQSRYHSQVTDDP